MLIVELMIATSSDQYKIWNIQILFGDGVSAKTVSWNVLL